MLLQTLCNSQEMLILWGRGGERVLPAICPECSSHLGPWIFQLHLFISGSSAWVPILYSAASKLSQSSKLGQAIIGLTSFYPSLNDDCPYCLMSNVFQTIVLIYSVHYLFLSGGRVNSVSVILSWLEAGVPT